jgi:hypothetical protein
VLLQKSFHVAADRMATASFVLESLFHQQYRSEFCDLTGLSLAAARSADFGVPRTCHKMVVHHAGRLHQRVADR